MKKYLSSIIVALLALTLHSCDAKEIYSVEKRGALPELSGIKDNAAWKNVRIMGDFRILNSGLLSPHKSSVQVLYDNEALLIRCIAYDPDLFTRKNDFLKRNSLELFIVPNSRQRNNYLQIITAPNGKIEYARINNVPIKDGAFSAKGLVSNQDHYIVEWRIPFVLLGVMPQKNAEWLFSVARNSMWQGKPLYSALTAQNVAFADVNNFAVLRFPENTSSEAVSRELAHRQNSELEMNIRAIENILSVLKNHRREMAELHLSNAFDSLAARFEKTRNKKGSAILKNREMRVIFSQAENLWYNYKLRSIVTGAK